MQQTHPEKYKQIFDVYDRCRSVQQTALEVDMPFGTVQDLVYVGTKKYPAVKSVIDAREAEMLIEDERRRKKNAEMRSSAVDFIVTSALKSVAETMSKVDVIPKGTLLANGRIEIDEVSHRTLVGTAKTAYELSESGKQQVNMQQQNVNVDINVGVDNQTLNVRVQEELKEFERLHGRARRKMGRNAFKQMLRKEIAKRKRVKEESK